MIVLFVLAVLPSALMVAIVAGSVGHAFAIEFAGNLWRPGRAILDGGSPYPLGELERTATYVREGHPPTGFEVGVYPAYPAPTLLMGTPFSLLPFAAARWVWFAICASCPALALRLLGVRDWRAYGATYLSVVVLSGVMLGSLTLPLLVGLAATWRYRDDWRRCAPLAAAVICGKLFLWPMVIWFVATRRFRAAGATTAVAAAGCAVGWAVIGFHGLTSYPHLLRTLSSIEQARGYSLVRAGLAVGLGSRAATSAAYTVGAVLLALGIRAAMQRSRRGDVQAFTLALFASFAFSPIVWQQYFALLFVPIALHRARFGALWLAPLLFWLAPYNSTERHPGRLLLAAAVLGLIGLASFAPPRGPKRADAATSWQ